jgi:cbb3-type cytochrome oxidase maturation protein
VESLYLLIPLSIVLVLAIGGLLGWAVMSGQFENLDAEGKRILEEERASQPPPSPPSSGSPPAGD